MTSDSSKQRSLIFLSLLCFSLADINDGLGPFLGVYLQGKGWSPDNIGYVMTIGGIAGLLFTTPLGALADITRYKRTLIGASILIIVFSCGVVFYSHEIIEVSVSKTLQCIAAASIMPTVMSITLGLVGQKELPIRLGITEAWSHTGNVCTAILGGIIGYFYDIQGIFFVLVLMAFLAIYSLFRINNNDIDYSAARGAQTVSTSSSFPDQHANNSFNNLTKTPKNTSHPQQSNDDKRAQRHQPEATFFNLLSIKPLIVVAITLFFFHLGNAALLPLLGQSAVNQFDVNPAVYTSATIVLAQVTMIGCALGGAKIAKRYGYTILFLLALIALPLRGSIAGLWVNPWNIIPVQIFDGIGAGLLGVATPGIIANMLEGTGRVNLGLGFVLTIQGLGASLSSTYGGVFAHYFGYNSAFFALSLAPSIGLIIFLLAKYLGLFHTAITLDE